MKGSKRGILGEGGKSKKQKGGAGKKAGERKRACLHLGAY